MSVVTHRVICTLQHVGGRGHDDEDDEEEAGKGDIVVAFEGDDEEINPASNEPSSFSSRPLPTTRSAFKLEA